MGHIALSTIASVYPTTGGAGFSVFILVTLAMGGAAAFATGRAIAATWRPRWHIGAYTLLLAAVARFLQFALFQQPLLSWPNFVVDGLILIGFALFGHRLTRARQMSEQYPWAFERAGIASWRARDGTTDASK